MNGLKERKNKTEQKGTIDDYQNGWKEKKRDRTDCKLRIKEKQKIRKKKKERMKEKKEIDQELE